MHLDYKVTTWIRVNGLEEDNLDKLKERLRNGENPLDIVFNEDIDSGDLDFDNISEVEEYMTPEENGWASTVEIYSDEGELLWNNSPEANLE